MNPTGSPQHSAWITQLTLAMISAQRPTERLHNAHLLGAPAVATESLAEHDGGVGGCDERLESGERSGLVLWHDVIIGLGFMVAFLTVGAGFGFVLGRAHG